VVDVAVVTTCRVMVKSRLQICGSADVDIGKLDVNFIFRLRVNVRVRVRVSNYLFNLPLLNYE